MLYSPLRKWSLALSSFGHRKFNSLLGFHFRNTSFHQFLFWPPFQLQRFSTATLMTTHNSIHSATAISSMDLKVSNMGKLTDHILELDRPISDNRLYRHIVLPNKLQTLLISDPDCDRAACSLNVGVGSLFDPVKLPGLAHFLEHMLFLGTEKYPNEDEYNKYLQQHGGESNAYTSDLNTCYYFSVSPEHLDGAVDRFAQFFIGPLFTQSATDRELDAVDSEHAKNVLTDARRTYQLTKHLANPKHPLNHFGTGNHQTLGDIPKQQGIDVRSELLEFHQKYYSANIMRLCIIGRESLDELEEMVRQDRFESVRNTDVHVPEGEKIGAPEVPFRKQDLGKLIKIIPVRDARTISFQWVLPEQTPRWMTKPSRYLSHLLGHEAEGSLLSALKAECLATELSAGIFLDVAGIALFHVQIQLTELALAGDGIDRVAQLVHQYVELLSSNSIQEWVVEELEQLAAMEFRFLSLAPPQQHVVTLSQSMHHFPPEKLLSGPYLSWKRDLEDIRGMVDCLTPDRLMVQLASKSFEPESNHEGWEKEPYYQTSFCVTKLDDHILSKWLHKDRVKRSADSANSSVYFPKPNPFIPKDLELKERTKQKEEMPKFPELVPLYKSPHMRSSRLYFKQDDTFDLPKAVLMLRFSSDLPRSDLEGLSKAELYLLTVQQIINEFAYDAEVAGLHYGICANVDSAYGGELGGFELQVAGYNDRLPVLLESLCSAVRKPQLKPEAFEVAKTILLRELKIMANNKQPYQQGMNFLNKLLQSPYYLPAERLSVIESLFYENICNMVDEQKNDLLCGLSVDALIQGNVTEEEAKELLKIVDTTFFDNSKIEKGITNLQPSMVVDLREDKLVRLRAHQMAANPDEANNAAILSIHLNASTVEDSAFLNLARAYLHQPFFDTLRTKQQLGYIVACTNSRVLHVNNLVFIVQSQRLKPHDVTRRIEAFLEEYLENPEEYLSEEEFEKLKESTISHAEEKPKRIGDEAHRNYNEVVSRRFQFDRRKKQADFLRTATREQFFQFIKVSLSKSPWIAVEVESHKEPASSTGAEITEENQGVIPINPKTPICWEDIGNDADAFLSTRIKSFFRFPLPGSQLNH